MSATKGPWVLRPMSYGYDLSVVGVSGGYGGWFIGLHGGNLDDMPAARAEFDANARLIAAAPELAEAAKKALPLMRAMLFATRAASDSELWDATTALEAALAKAGVK